MIKNTTTSPWNSWKLDKHPPASWIRYLGDLDGGRRSGEAGLAGFELADRAELALAEAVDASDSEPVVEAWRQLLLLSALVVLRPTHLPLSGRKQRTQSLGQQASSSY